ncbi:unnamed protein product [Rotaria magnacalcarata]|uniref:Uncharacterized protein n=1 Tax=Rotaria magnacalcarata TaxID=392030 RepID=A0A816Y6V2_9BILA|nr:unnamed protein product [Rotaria magnacalcarata]
MSCISGSSTRNCCCQCRRSTVTGSSLSSCSGISITIVGRSFINTSLDVCVNACNSGRSGSNNTHVCYTDASGAVTCCSNTCSYRNAYQKRTLTDISC